MGTENPEKNTRGLLRDLQSQEPVGGSNSNGLFEILSRIFEFLGMNVNASMAGVTEQHIVNSPVFQSELRSKGIDPEQYQRKTHESVPGQSGVSQGIFANDDTSDAALRAAINIGIERHAEALEDRGVGYGFGDKNSDEGAIDCSGFVGESVKEAMNAALPGASSKLTGTFANHSDGQISGLAMKTGEMLVGRDVNVSSMKAGMVIGIDSGDKGWDRGRDLGVDHVGIVYVDTETGVKMFAESRGGGVGVDTTPLDEKLAEYNSKGYKLYASDTVKLASDEYKLQVAAKVQHNTELGQSTVAQNDANPDDAQPNDTAAIVAPAV